MLLLPGGPSKKGPSRPPPVTEKRPLFTLYKRSQAWSLLAPTTICHFQRGEEQKEQKQRQFFVSPSKMANRARGLPSTLFSQVGGWGTLAPYIMAGVGPPKCPHSIANVLVNLALCIARPIQALRARNIVKQKVLAIFKKNESSMKN